MMKKILGHKEAYKGMGVCAAAQPEYAVAHLQSHSSQARHGTGTLVGPLDIRHPAHPISSLRTPPVFPDAHRVAPITPAGARCDPSRGAV